MICSICKLTSRELRENVEAMLTKNGGSLTSEDIKTLSTTFPDKIDEIDKISDQDCDMHYLFHMSATREAPVISKEDIDREVDSLAKDIGKDEANILLDVGNKQYATFNLLTNKINEALKDKSGDELNNVVVHSSMLDLYKEVGSSLRLTIREIRDLNAAVNGDKNSANEGLKALARALNPNKHVGDQSPEDPEAGEATKEADNDDGGEPDLTTKEFDEQ